VSSKLRARIITIGGAVLIVGLASLGVFMSLNSGSIIYHGATDGRTVTTKGHPWLMAIVFVCLTVLCVTWLGIISELREEREQTP
jgi:hypothetical protein